MKHSKDKKGLKKSDKIITDKAENPKDDIENKENWAEKSARWILRKPIVILLVILVFFITQFSILGETINKINDFYNQTFRWRNLEGEKINSLSASIHVDNFIDVLGTPLFLNNPDYLKEGYNEYTFRERGYWVQAVTDKIGSVVFYAVTVCDESFNPTIYSSLFDQPIILGESTFKDISDDITYSHYFYPTNTANAYLIEEKYGGNPGKYQTIVWGINDTCGRSGMDDCYIGEGRIDRSVAKINTFGETAPFYQFLHSDFGSDETVLFNRIQIGVDRIQVRTYEDK